MLRGPHPEIARLGLDVQATIVQSIAAAHGAALSAPTRPGGGLLVEVRFPPAPGNGPGTVICRVPVLG